MSNQNNLRPSKTPGKVRIVSLDVARGWMLITSVTSVAVLAPRPDWLVHASWRGITLYDLIFPLFVTLSGVGMAFAYKRKVDLKVTLRRVVVLTTVGLLYNGVSSGSWDPSAFRFTGVLQLYAVLVAVIALAHFVLKTWKAWAITTLVSSALFALLFCYIASNCVLGTPTPMCNLSLAIDYPLFGDHMLAQGRLGHDPEGLVSILGAILTAIGGTTAGHMTLQYMNTNLRSLGLRLTAWAGVLLVWGFGLSFLFPAFKRLWTPPFALIAGSAGLLLFATAFLAFDLIGRSLNSPTVAKVAWPFAALGRNSLLVYFGSHLVIAVLARNYLPGSDIPLTYQIAEAISVGLPGNLEFVLLNLVAWWVLAIVLHRKQIYIRA